MLKSTTAILVAFLLLCGPISIGALAWGVAQTSSGSAFGSGVFEGVTAAQLQTVETTITDFNPKSRPQVSLTEAKAQYS